MAATGFEAFADVKTGADVRVGGKLHCCASDRAEHLPVNLRRQMSAMREIARGSLSSMPVNSAIKAG
jgi:hypothetical protein